MAQAANKRSTSVNVATPALQVALEYDDDPVSDYEHSRVRKAEADSKAGRLLPYSAVTAYLANLRREAKAS